MEFYEKTLESNSIFKGNVTEYVVMKVELPNGNTAQREIVRQDDAGSFMAIKMA